VPPVTLPFASVPASAQSWVTPRAPMAKSEAGSPGLERRGSPLLTSRTDGGCMTARSVSFSTSAAQAASPGAGGASMSLRSKFTDLRDEMKRRRSSQTLDGSRRNVDPAEVAEAVLADRRGDSVSFSSAPAPPDQPTTAPTPSQSSSAVPLVNMKLLAPAPSTTTPVGLTQKLAAQPISAFPCGVSSSIPPSPLPAQGGPAGTAPYVAPRQSPSQSGLSPSPVLQNGVVGAVSSSLAAAGPWRDQTFQLATAAGPEGLGSSQSAAMPQSPAAAIAGMYSSLMAPSMIGSARPSSPKNRATAVSGDPPQSPGALVGGQGPLRLISIPMDKVTAVPSSSFSARSASGSFTAVPGGSDRSRRSMAFVATSSAMPSGSAAATGSRSQPMSGQAQSRPSSRSAETTREEHDPLHDAVVRFTSQRPSARFPMVRLSRGVYLYGTKKLVIAVHNEKLMVRIGGGFVNLESHLLDADRAVIAHSPTIPVVTTHRHRGR